MSPFDSSPSMDDELDNIVVLTDEDGNDVEFEFLDVVALEGREYVVLLPVEAMDAGMVVIFRIEGDGGEEEAYVALEDEDEANRVFRAFQEKNKDVFNFTDQ